MSRSDDDGVTWSDPTSLADDGPWGGEPINQLYAHGRVYLVNERKTVADFGGWPAAVYAPVVMSAPVDADLTQRDALDLSQLAQFPRRAVQVWGSEANRGTLLCRGFLCTGQ